MNAPAAPPSGGTDAPLRRPLSALARPLIALATHLQQARPRDPLALHSTLVAAATDFERAAAAAGYDEPTTVAASYLLCTWLDEVVAHARWPGIGPGLLMQLHGERDGSARVLRLLARLLAEPERHRELLLLGHTCLGLGLRGSAREPSDSGRLDMLRSRLYRSVQRGEAELPIAPTWRPAITAAPRPRWRRHAAALLLLLGLAAIGTYSASRLALASQVDAVFASMQRLSFDTAPPAEAPPKLAHGARLAPLLADDAAAGRIDVRDEFARTVLTLRADALFERDAPRLVAGQSQLLSRVAKALASTPGKVVVTGYTDGADPRSARVPSAWHQSFEWARAVADELRNGLPAERLEAEAGGDYAPAGVAPQRRVEIVLYP